MPSEASQDFLFLRGLRCIKATTKYSEKVSGEANEKRSFFKFDCSDPSPACRK